MKTYAIRRRSGFKTPQDLEAAGSRSKRIGDEEMPDDIRWIRTYALAEPDGQVGTICIYEASGPDAIREHAARVGMPADEIVAVTGTVVVRPDPPPDAAR